MLELVSIIQELVVGRVADGHQVLALDFDLQTVHPGPSVLRGLPEAHDVLRTTRGLGVAGHLIFLAGSHRATGPVAGFSSQPWGGSPDSRVRCKAGLEKTGGLSVSEVIFVQNNTPFFASASLV